MRCSVFRRIDEFPTALRADSTFTPYSTVGARSTLYLSDRSSHSCSAMMVAQPSGR